MSSAADYVVDYVAKGANASEWQMVLVEAGPWQDVSRELLRLQERLYDSIDAVLDGELVTEFPEANGARIIIRVDCIDVPEAKVADFFQRFSTGVFQLEDYRKSLERHEFATDIAFAINFERRH